MAAVFTPNRALLNPKFDGYKLDAVDHDDVISSYPLVHKLSQIAPSAKSPLTFQEVQSRIRHNHLCIGPNGRAVYVDEELNVMSVVLDNPKLVPSYQVLYELPRQIHSDSADPAHQEYPSAVFLDAETLFVSDGAGTLYALRLEAEGPAQLLNCFELSIPEQYQSAHMNVPFKVHSAARDASGGCTVVLSSRHYSNVPRSEDLSATKRSIPSPQFDIWAVSVDLGRIPQDQPLKLDIAWHRRGGNVPSYVEYVEEERAFVLLGSSPYQSPSAPAPASYEPTLDEIAPIPRADEHLDGNGVGASTIHPKPPPYSWTQTSDQVTLAFPLPSSTPREAIKVTFSPTTLTVLVSGGVESAVPLPHYALRKLWAPIQSSDCLWTFDRSAEHAYGLLTLHIDKQHEGTRWPQVFADDDDAVPETLDPSELYQIREALEKYTSALQTGGDASGLGLGSGMPSLAAGELDDEVDADMGEVVALTWVAPDGSTQAWLDAGAGAPFSVLSTPLPGPGAAHPSLVVKTGLDGAVYTLARADGGGGPAWTHTSTFCVLSFVLASKRDTRFVHHAGARAVVAFESGARGMGCNAYVYRSTARAGDTSAKQCILKIDDGSGGPLLGVGMTRTGDGREVILCLCEGRLVVVHDLL